MKPLSIGLAALGIAGTVLASPVAADAAQGRHGAFAAGAAAGVVGGAIIGSQLNRPRYGYEEPDYCHVERHRVYLDNGDVIVRRVRVCD